MRNTLGANHSFVGASFQGWFICLLVIFPTFFPRSAGSRRAWVADMIVVLLDTRAS